MCNTRSTKKLVSHIFVNRVQGTLTSVSVIAILLVIFSAIAILQVETDPNSNIKTAEVTIPRDTIGIIKHEYISYGAYEVEFKLPGLRVMVYCERNSLKLIGT